MTEIVTTIQARQRQKARAVEVLFADEAHWSTEPYVQRGWCRKGKKTTIPGPVKRQTTTIFGA